MADSTVDNMKGCKKVLENIYMLAEDMKDSVEHMRGYLLQGKFCYE